MFPLQFLRSKIEEVNNSASEQIVLPALPKHLYSYTAEALGVASNSLVKLNIYENLDHFKFDSKLSDGDDLFVIQKGERFDPDILTQYGYNRVARVWEPIEYSLFGDVVILWIKGYANPLRVSLFGNKVENIEIVDATTRRSIGSKSLFTIEHVELDHSERRKYNPPEIIVGNEASEVQFDYEFAVIKDLSVTQAKNMGESYLDLGFRTLPSNISIETHPALKGSKIKFITDSDSDISKVAELFGGEAEVVTDKESLLTKGFLSMFTSEAYITRYEIFGEINLADIEITGVKAAVASSRKGNLLKQEIFKKIKPTDFVVHEDHGLGVYNGIVEYNDNEYLEVLYAKSDKLLIPLNQATKITKYIGSGSPQLTTLSGGMWRRIRKVADHDAEEFAKELVQLYAMRQLSAHKEHDWLNIDLHSLDQFIEAFKYSDTEDQKVVTDQIISDLQSGIPMDRLLVGDVGFGKTEVAFRAIFAVANGGHQVALLAPTTILVEQHYVLMKERFKGFNLNISKLSSFVEKDQLNKIYQDLEEGKIDIIVGTHALLSDKVKFNKLGLIVIDEEQKFGVKQKEKLKEHKVDTNILSLSATPIPRTLNLSLGGLKDISIIATPPPGRKPVMNIFEQFDWDKVETYLQTEMKRGGQAYFLHNRVRNIEFYRKKISDMFPKKVVALAHGQMDPHKLSEVMADFAKGIIDILVCTSIIENGIDLPTVNTLIVNDANLFGLSQLYQIRGRVGRSDRQAYSYFMYQTLTGKSGERLDALSDSSAIGAGFLLANRDLEIRGAGNFLGKEQSGTINSVGYGMYVSLIEQKIVELRASNS